MDENSIKSKKISPKAELLGLMCLLLALGLFCVGATRALIPKRLNYGATWEMYLQEQPDSIDVLFMGSSLVYCDIVPAVLYKESGISAYVMAGPEQPLPATYYYLRECCETQSPSTVFVECTGLVSNWQADVTWTCKPNLTYMPWTMNRVAPTLDYTEGDTRTELLFPLYSYHGRWTELRLSDLKPLGTDPLAGYTYLEEICPFSGFIQRQVADTLLETPKGYKHNLEYVQKILDFCREKGIEPVFYLTPSVMRLPEEWSRRIRADLADLGIQLINFNDDFDSLGLDISTDFFDSLHLNCRGAEKFSRYLGGRLGQWARASAPHDEEVWQERVGHFYRRLETTAEAEPKYKDDATAASAKAKEEG